MEEIWLPIKGYEGFYEISNKGRVKSLPRNGTIKKPKILALSNDCDGYKIITLNKKGVAKTEKVHRLVGIAFIPNPMDKPQINHIDGDKTNNLVANLEWCTPTENNRHRCRVLNYKNVPHHCKKVRCIETGKVYESIKAAAREKNGSSSNLKNAITKRGQQRFAGLHWEFV